MGRVTDDERCKAAENLRYLADYPGAPVQYAEQLRDELYGAVFSDGLAHDCSELFTRLADLIEPDTTTDTTKDAQDTTKCDRDALLALAEEMENVRSGYTAKAWFTFNARRIREACGVICDD